MNNPLNKITIKNLKAIFSQNEKILAVYLFGSQVQGFAKTNSDLDMAVFLTNRNEISNQKILNFLMKKNIKIPYEIDLVCVDLSSPPLLLMQIVKNGFCIYKKSQNKKVDLEAKIMNIYFDNQHIRSIYKYYLDKSFKENTYGL